MLYHLSPLLSVRDHCRRESRTQREKGKVLARQNICTHKDSGITNDANLYATKTMQNPTNPLEHLQRVITVSEETNKIVACLPAFEL